MLILDLIPEHIDKLDASCLENGKVVELLALCELQVGNN